MQKLAIFFVFIYCFFSCEESETKKDNIRVIENITWIHSYEEDIDSLYVYRPSGYNFPISRTREGFRLEPGGKFIEYAIAPNDGIDTLERVWELDQYNIIVRERTNTGDLKLDYFIQLIDYNANRIKCIIHK